MCLCCDVFAQTKIMPGDETGTQADAVTRRKLQNARECSARQVKQPRSAAVPASPNYSYF
jgi:hypothetical protein